MKKIVYQGNNFKGKREWKKAAFCFEAALQIEKNPRQRFELLLSLNSCYFKLGQKKEAAIISERLKDSLTSESALFNIFPSKGVLKIERNSGEKFLGRKYSWKELY